MSINFYDNAIYNKIQKWVKDPKMRILKPNETSRLFRMEADMSDDKPLKLPIIALSRDREIEILNGQKQVKTFDGFKHSINEKTSMPINVIPIKLGYQIDIYTRGMEEASEYVRNFVFNFVNLPKLKVEIPYNGTNYEHISNIWINGNIVDNSDISERLFPDQFVRLTISVTIDDAYLFSLPIKDNYELVYADVETKYSSEIENQGIAYTK